MGAMRVHPAPKKRNITIRYEANAILAAAAAAAASGRGGGGGRQKKLRRLPHIFSKVLELPFGADAEVSVEEDSDGFRFVAAAADLWDDVRALPVEIYPGVMKVVIRDASAASADAGEVDEGALELNRWRFRLPPYTRPSLATAAYVDGELIVTVPKGSGSDGDEEEGGVLSPRGHLNRGIGRLMLVQ